MLGVDKLEIDDMAPNCRCINFTKGGGAEMYLVGKAPPTPLHHHLNALLPHTVLKYTYSFSVTCCGAIRSATLGGGWLVVCVGRRMNRIVRSVASWCIQCILMCLESVLNYVCTIRGLCYCTRRCARVCVRVCVRACVCVCVFCVCVCVCVCV